MVGVDLMPSWSAKIISDTATPKLETFRDNIEREVEAQLDVVGADMVDLAKSLAPYRTGFLRDSIHHQASGFLLGFSADAYYAAYQEFGSSRCPPHPFMRPSLDAHKQRILDALIVGCMNALSV